MPFMNAQLTSSQRVLSYAVLMHVDVASRLAIPIYLGLQGGCLICFVLPTSNHSNQF
jgi:hypothetical protein